MATHIGSGGVSFGGKAITCYYVIIHTAFSVGDIVFPVYLANQGHLERVCIKKIYAFADPALETMYKDTFNAMWAESELVPHATALEMAIAYLEMKEAGVQAEIDEIAYD